MTSFDSAIQTLIPRFLRMLRVVGIRDPGDYFEIDHFRKTINLFLPLKTNLVHPLSIHFTERQWYTPLSKANEHLYSCVNSQKRILAKRGFKVKERHVRDRTYVLVGKTYTRTVKGTIRRTYSGLRVAGFVFKKDWLKEVFSILSRYFSKRASQLQQACEMKGIKPYGRLAEFIKMLRVYSESIAIVMLD
mgnify:CR=1 FL=1